MASSKRKTKSLKAAVPLKPEQLRKTCDPGRFKFASTATLKPPKGILGQARAVEAIELGTEIAHEGFNLFVIGAHGCGMQSAVLDLLEVKARKQPAPCDWVYVNNFEAADNPTALCLPAGQASNPRCHGRHGGRSARSRRATFEADEYQNRRRAIEAEVKQRQESAFAELQKKAGELGTAVLHTPSGFAVAPMREGEVLKPEQFNELDEAERKQIEQAIETVQHELELALQGMPKLMTEARRALRDLDRQYAAAAIGHSIADIERTFGEIPGMRAYLDAVKDDLAKHIYLFLMTPEMQAQAGEQPVTGPFEPQVEDPRLRKYKVNVIVSADGACNGKGAPIEREERPSLANLVGRVDHLSQMGGTADRLHPDQAGGAAPRQWRLPADRCAQASDPALCLGRLEACLEERPDNR